MKAVRNDLSAERLRAVLNYEPKTGDFTWKVQPNGRVPIGTTAGNISRQTGYVNIQVDGTIYPAGRLAWLYMTGDYPCGDVDHISGVKTNNRWENLRDVSRTVNTQNARKPRSNNKSGFLGVSVNPGGKGWRAQISANGKVIYLGTYASPEDAHAAYLSAKRELHEGCTI